MDTNLHQLFNLRPKLKAFDSPIESELARVLLKYIAQDTSLENQVHIATQNGDFRLDFLLSNGHKKVAFEANGKDFHQYDLDLFRGSLILGFTEVHSIYYIRGKDIMYNLESVLWAVAQRESELFSPRGLTQLEVLNRSDNTVTSSEFITGYCTDSSIETVSPMGQIYDIKYLSKTMDNPIWKRLHQIALANPGKKVQELIEISDREGHCWF